MASQDIIISLINSRFDAQEKRFDAQDKRIAIIEKNIFDIKLSQAKSQASLEHLQNSITWGFALVALVCAFVGLFKNKEPREKSSRDYLSRAEVQAMIDDALKKYQQ